MAIFAFFVLRYIEKQNKEFYDMIDKMQKQMESGKDNVEEEEGAFAGAAAVVPVVAAPSKEAPPTHGL